MRPSTPDTCKEFYGFRDMPFSVAVDGEQKSIYLSQNYETSLAVLVSSLDNYMALTLVLGVDGIGKTTLINYVLKHIQQNFTVGVISGHIDTSQELLERTLASFGHISKSNSRAEMVQQLQNILCAEIEKHRGQPSLLVIDDADNMSFDALEGVELLLGLNNENRQLLQLILVGQPELKKLLNEPKLHSLSKMLCPVKALTAEETQHYIHHRLNLVGMVDILFDEQVCSAIYKYSEGIPKKINSICNEALLLSSSEQKHKISTTLIGKAANYSEQAIPTEQIVSHYRPDSPAIPDSRTSGQYYKSAMAKGFMFAGGILGMIFVGTSLFSPPVDQKIDVAHEIGQNPDKNISNTEIPNWEPSPKKIKSLENLANKDRSSDENLQNEASVKKAATKNLLAAAERHLLALRLSTPDGENALDIYHEILDREPNNEMALKGIERIAKKYIELADRESRQGAVSKARKYLKQAAAVLPESDAIQKALHSTTKALGQAKKMQADSRQIPSTKKKIVSLVGDETNQDFTINKNNPKNVPEISKTQHQAKLQLQNVPDTKNDKALLKTAKQVSVISSNKEGDPVHQETVFAAVETKKVVDNQLENLLNEAENQRKVQQLTQPAGNNALESYTKVLQIDPNNLIAKKGLGSIVKQYQILAETALSDGNTNRALVIANEGLAAFPENQELQILRNNVIVQQDTIHKKTEVPAKKKSKHKERGLRSFGTF